METNLVIWRRSKVDNEGSADNKYFRFKFVVKFTNFCPILHIRKGRAKISVLRNFIHAKAGINKFIFEIQRGMKPCFNKIR